MSKNFSKGVLLKGLPFDTSLDQIKTFFKAISIPDEHISIIKFRDGQQTGLGFVKLKDEQMEHALLMDKNHIGKRYVEVLPSDETELHHLVLKSRSGMVDAREINRIAGKEAKKGVVKRDRSPIRKRLQTHFAYITGIPQGHQYKEVRRFFKGILIGMNCIHLLKEADSRDFRGDGYIEFKDSEECRKALFLDGEMMDGSIIRLEPCTQEEFDDAMRHLESGGSGDRRRRSPSPLRFKEEESYFTPAYREREGRYRNTVATMAYGGHGVIERNRPPADDLPPAWRDSLPPQPPLDAFGRGVDNGGHGHIPLVSNQGFGRSEDKYPALLSLSGGALLGPPVAQKPLMTVPVSQVERKIVRLEGLPYDATLHDIVDFFRGFNVNLEHVRIQCRDDGSPSGKAFVTLPNEKFAQSAVRDLNKKYVRGRFVELFLV
jgi:RNA recognition motif-containing protein